MGLVSVVVLLSLVSGLRLRFEGHPKPNTLNRVL